MILMPLAAAIFMAALVALRLSRLVEFNSYKLDDIQNAESYIDNQLLNVTYDAGNLKPAGYDYTVNGKKMGEYYYLYDNDQIYLFALKYSGIEKLKNGENTLNFRITTDSSTVNMITRDLSDSFDTEINNLSGFVNPIILNEFEFPYYKIIISRGFLYFSFTAFAIIMLYLLKTIISPSSSYQASILKKFGKVKDMVSILDDELKNNLLYSGEESYVTENYLVTAYISKIDVVRLDDIKYLSKHVEEKKGLFTKHNIYKLTASNVDKLYYENDFIDEEVLDNIIYYIRREDLVDETEELERNT